MSKNARKKKGSARPVATPATPEINRRPAPPATRLGHRPALIGGAIGGILIGVFALLLSPAVDVAGVFSGADSGRRAVSVDQLSATPPTPAFAETVTPLLEADGYAVDYYSGDQVTVELYRDLP